MAFDLIKGYVEKDPHFLNADERPKRDFVLKIHLLTQVRGRVELRRRGEHEVGHLRRLEPAGQG